MFWMKKHKKLIRYCGAVMFRSPVVQLMVDLFFLLKIVAKLCVDWASRSFWCDKNYVPG